MAIKPTDQADVFLREVDEELRREQLTNFVTRYGWAIIAGVVLLIAAVGGYLWWQERRQQQAAEQATTLIEATEALQAGNRDAAAPKIEELVNSDIRGYRAAGLFARAASEIEANNIPAAVATLRSIHEDEKLAEPYRQAALIRQTQLEFDGLQPQAVIQRLGPLARPGSAWLGTAGEMVGIAWLKLGQPQRAAPVFAAIARDESVPATIRQRTVQMAGSLGINAVEEPAGEAPAAPAPASEGERNTAE